MSGIRKEDGAEDGGMMNWRVQWATGLWTVGIGALLALPAHGQVEKNRPAESRAAAGVLKQSSVEVERIASDTEPAEREIDDPATGDRWILMRDAAHPEGPGRMALIAPERTENRFAGARGAGTESASSILPVLVIHGGDKIIVEEHTTVVDARLEAVALGPAARGNSFRVRLTIGGKVIFAVATAPGHAAVASPIGAQQ
jgi:hypothetical protein